jgi:ABC-type sugar transport system substrate-binding protein
MNKGVRRAMTTLRPAVAALLLGTFAAPAEAFKVGMAVGGNAPDEWQKAQGDVAAALAKQRGWDYIELSNNADGPTAVKNAGVFVQAHVDAVIQFNQQPSVNPVLATKYAAAHIPVITYDIAQKGFYFVGVDNLAAGQLGGQALGQIVKAKWNCQPDMVLSAEFTAVGIVNTWRTGGMRDGLKKVCPDIPEGNFVSFEAGDQNTSEANARDQLAAHPDAKKILIVGISDNPEVGAIQAAAQLGRADDVIAWGQDGSRITGSNVDPHLVGSVFYFLEGYPVYAFRILDQIAAGNPPPMKDTAEDPAQRVPPCVVTAAQAQAVPSMPDRIAKLAAAPKGTTEYDLFCPKP